MSNQNRKVTGIGGIFFKSSDPTESRDWYSKHLGLKTNEYGSLFEFRQAEAPEKVGYTQWSPFGDDTKYFEPSKKEFMINFRVENIESLVQELKADGVNVLDEIETFEYGKFVHIMDNDNNKLELWEPVDAVFTAEYKDHTTK
jgi:predicted enzyme related to lactoylglutathione lyase